MILMKNNFQNWYKFILYLGNRSQENPLITGPIEMTAV